MAKIKYRNQYTEGYEEKGLSLLNDDGLANYWLGFIAADGNLYNSTVSVALSIKDKNHLEKFSNFTKTNNIKKYTCTAKGKTYETCGCRFSNKDVVEYLESIGITSSKSKDMKILKDLDWDFVRGVFDGDGSVGIYDYKGRSTEYRCNFTSGSKEFTNQLNTFLNKHGIKTAIYNDKDTQRLSIATKSIVNFMDKLYTDSDVALERKKLIFKQIKKQRHGKD